jgi:broad specificity phosphatase PhoE
MPSLTLLFTRHGATTDNLLRVLQGHRDTSLTSDGHTDARNLAAKLAELYPLRGVDAVYYSPLLRIRQTVQAYLDLCAPPGGHDGGVFGDLVSREEQEKAEAEDGLRREGGPGGGGGAHESQQGGDTGGRKLPRPELHAEEDLKGQYLGPLEGQSYDAIDMSSPRSADVVRGVEVFDDFVARLLGVLGGIVGREVETLRQAARTGEQKGERVVMIATHGVGITSLFKALEGSPPCDNFGRPVAVRGDDAYEVRWTDADDVARIRVEGAEGLPLNREGGVDWEVIREGGKRPLVIEVWGKKEKAL